MVAAAALAVTSEAFCDRPPAARTTAVCEAPPPPGIAPNSAPPRLAAPVATSSRLASMGGSSRAGKGATHRDRFGETHQRHPERPRHQLLDQRKIRQRERRESLRDQADRRDSQRLQAEEPRRGDAAADGDQRRRRMRP